MGASAFDNVAVALVHYPVYDKNRQIVATAVTNLDIHDIARAARTFGLYRYYIVTPVAGQQALAGRIVKHWQDGWGARYNPKRKTALDLVSIVSSLDDALEDLEAVLGAPARLVTTGARSSAETVSCGRLSSLVKEREHSYLLVFGTGWGLAEEIASRADLILEPIRGTGDYNHLSVRSAAAIIFDRLFGMQLSSRA
ncbi:RNA methyltransferase [Geobacter sp.]|uniref:RNA methyltransferase n=1 Tax=Geobacter sp. TaxID=46610 RepID=UPI002620A09B|nr:RNA methyltransferase [Geobacter sp.]